MTDSTTQNVQRKETELNMFDSEKELRIADIIGESIVDGPGFRMTVFTQGCPHHCEGCHNPHTHSFEGGRVVTVGEIVDKFKKNPLLSGITLSGGEPFCQPGACAEIAKAVHSLKKNVIVYSGYTFEQLFEMSEKNNDIKELLLNCDILIDGKFDLSQRSLELRFKGSKNQRTLDLKMSVQEGRAVETTI